MLDPEGGQSSREPSQGAGVEAAEMSLTARKAASLLGAAALGVTALTAMAGAGQAAASAVRASGPGPGFSKLSASQVKARSSGKRERMVVVFDDQLRNLPANTAHRQAR